MNTSTQNTAAVATPATKEERKAARDRMMKTALKGAEIIVVVAAVAIVGKAIYDAVTASTQDSIEGTAVLSVE